MTHARQRGSLWQQWSEHWDQAGSAAHAETMGRAWPRSPGDDQRTQKKTKAKAKAKIRRSRAKEGGEAREAKELSADADAGAGLDRKMYPLRGRLGLGDLGTRNCCVVLTRLEESEGQTAAREDGRRRPRGGDKQWGGQHSRAGRSKPCKPCKCRKKGCKVCKVSSRALQLPPLPPSPPPQLQLPKNKPPKPDAPALCLPPEFPQEPRKRRLASLNAEAVNSLLFDREDTQQASRLTKKQQQQQQQQQCPSLKGECAHVAKDTAKETGGLKRAGQGRKRTPAHSEGCSSPKKAKKAKLDTQELREAHQLSLSLDSPTPRRLAGLNAAALLKLTSTSAGVKRRVKTECKQGSGTMRSKQQQQQPPPPQQQQQQQQQQHHHHHHHHHRHLSKSQTLQHKSHQQPPIQQQQQQQVLQRCCSLCKKEAYQQEALWEGTAGGHGFIRPGFQCRSMLGYPLKQVKEEQTETEVNPYFCCSPERSVEYCHRLALFLDQKAYQETDEHGLPPVKGFLAHPAALAINPHPYPCYSGYYVHIAHHGASSPPPISTAPVPYPPPPSSVAPIALCSSGVQRPKLLPPSSTALTHAPPPGGIPHPAYCSSVGACYGGETCRMGPYGYRGSPHLQARGCSYSADCSSCNRKIKMEDYPYPLEEHSPSIPVSPPLPLSVCPMPSVPPSPQPVPHLQTPLSDSAAPQAQLRVARECPQSAKPPSGSRSGARTNAPSSVVCPHRKDNQLGPGSASEAGSKQQKISRRRATNGWLPVGVPSEKEVFVVGEESMALRRCYEAVQRAGEVIRVRDTVLLRSGPRKKSLPYVAKVSAFWEDPETGEMMMSLFWYYRPEHTQGGRNPSMHCENEIFASRHQDENSVACIEDKCYVLTLAQYCRFCALVKRHADGLPKSLPVVPPSLGYTVPAHRRVPANVDPELVFVCRHVYDFRYGRLLKNLQ